MNARCLLSVLAIVAAALPAAGRWPDDPARNLEICTQPGRQYLTRILLTSDQGCYISWVDTSDWGIHLQRLDAAGGVMWAGRARPPRGLMWRWTARTTSSSLSMM